MGGFLLGGNRGTARAAQVNQHLVWVWQFATDGEPNIIGARLRDHGLGILLKTHDGVSWMSEYDKSRYAVSGPDQLMVLARYFEDAGVPFHAWCVVHGTNPIREAHMAAAVALSGARSLYLDIEPHAGFWRGTSADAIRFGNEFRRLVPDARVVLSIDPRPWVVEKTPMREFVAFSDAIAPQQYWRSFDSQANYEKFTLAGFPVVRGGMTPEFLLSVSEALLTSYGLPLEHVGQGNTDNTDEWLRLINGVYAHGGNQVTVWRYGVTPAPIFSLLRDIPARQPIIPVVQTSGGVYIVEPGDSLGAIAAHFGITVEELAAHNGITDANFLYVGQELQIPGAGGAVAAGGVSSPPPSPNVSDLVYVVEPGDSLFGIAGRFGTTVDAIVELNGIADPNFLSVGQELRIPA